MITLLINLEEVEDKQYKLYIKPGKRRVHIKPDKEIVEKKTEITLKSSELKEGMSLTKNLYTTHGLLVQNKNTKITKKEIEHIIKFENAEKVKYDLFVKPGSEQKETIKEEKNIMPF